MTIRRAILACVLMLAQQGAAHAADLAAGQKLARSICMACHVVAPGSGPAEATAGIPSFMSVAAKAGQSEDRLKGFILNPHPPMPRVQLTVHELENLAAYIMSLKQQ